MSRIGQQQINDYGEASESGDLRPYFFHRDASDVLEEAFDTLFRRRQERLLSSAATIVNGQDVINEQRRTLFEHDETMRRLFDDDFEAFCAALDKPWLFDERLRRWQGQSPRGEYKKHPLGWDGQQSPTREWEACAGDGGDDLSVGDTDPVYDQAFQWACQTERWVQRLIAGQSERDRDLLRIAANTTLVPVKVAFGLSASFDEDIAGLRTAWLGYRQAAIFLQRVLESLASCYGRRIGRPQVVHQLLDEGRELLADIESRIAEIESEIRHLESGGGAS